MIMQDTHEKSIVISVRLPNKVKMELNRQSDVAGTSISEGNPNSRLPRGGGVVGVNESSSS